MINIQDFLNDLAKSKGYEGDYMTVQTAINWIAMNINVNNDGGINVDGILNLVKDNHYTKEEVDVLLKEVATNRAKTL